ncbi:MAG: 5-formyltetrahydrofolate cyclo-ligase [Bdellovibrionales bacterium]|nr:5-formyltetrahydrofolate cyclo-ligase [Bdellovibrionales bacterium]
MFSKAVLRKKLQAKRLGLFDSSDPQVRNEKLSRQVAEYLRGEAPSIWASYQPRAFEVNPNLDLGQTPHRWVFPRVVGESLEFFEPRDDGDWELGYAGIKEPALASKLTAVEMKKLAGMLVPGVAFDNRGHRIGSGKGFYDRVLVHFQGLKVGVTWEAMVETHALPIEPHDVPMDVLITEDCVREMRKG